jgi:hypothetical protein
LVLVRVARLHGDLGRTHLLGRGGREDTDGTRSDDGDPGSAGRSHPGDSYARPRFPAPPATPTGAERLLG